MICLYLISYSIEHVLLFEGCLLGLSLRVCTSFPWGHFSLYEPLSLCSWRDESFSWESWVLWDLLFLGSKLSNLSIRSSYQCFLYYSIMGDRIYLYCIDMRCSSFLFTFSLLSFDFSPFLSYYSFFFSSHPNTYTPSWFDTFLHDPLMALLLLFLSHFTINILIYSS